jgi:hypothetical protein
MSNARRLLTACADLATMAAPVALALLAVAAVFVYWPGPILGLGAMLLIAWLCSKRITKIGSEHHY